MTDTTGTPSCLPGLATRHSLTLTPETSRAQLAALDAAMTALGGLGTCVAFRRYRNPISFWL